MFRKDIFREDKQSTLSFMNKCEQIFKLCLILVFLNLIICLNKSSAVYLHNDYMTEDAKTSYIAEYRPGVLLVKLRAASNLSRFREYYEYGKDLETFNQMMGLKSMESLLTNVSNTSSHFYSSSTSANDIYIYHFSEDADIVDLMEAYNNHPAVEYAEPDYIIHYYSFDNEDENHTPNDPDFYDLWGLNNTIGSVGADIKALDAWKYTTGDTNVVVAVIDSGVYYTHPDLAENIWINVNEIPNNGEDDDENGYIDDYYGYNVYNNFSDPIDEFGHGTHVAGIVGAVGNNQQGIVGVNWKVSIMCLKLGGDSDQAFISSAIKAIDYAIKMGADIINASWGSTVYSHNLEYMIQRAGEAGILFIAASGNDSVNIDTSPRYPASYNLTNIIAVAATDRYDALADFSNYGSKSVDIAAPGVDVYSTYLYDSYELMSGTSMAAPFVSGVAALIKATKPGISLSELRDSILNNTDQIPSLLEKVTTGGRLNAYKSLNFFIKIADPTPENGKWPAIPDSSFSFYPPSFPLFPFTYPVNPYIFHSFIFMSQPYTFFPVYPIMPIYQLPILIYHFPNMTQPVFPIVTLPFPYIRLFTPPLANWNIFSLRRINPQTGIALDGYQQYLRYVLNCSLY